MSNEEDFEVVGMTGIDSGMLLVIDPCYLDDVQGALDKGVAVLVSSTAGDGLHPVFVDGEFLTIMGSEDSTWEPQDTLPIWD